MGPSNRQVASMRSLRRAARNVAVFHLPCGTLSTRRSPFGAQPRSWVTAQAIEDANARRRALELAARDARYFAERLASAVLQPEPASSTAVAFGSRVTVLRDNGRRQTFRIVGEDEAD